MGRDLTSLPISASFQYLLQKSGSEVNDGLGADVDYLNISASYATSASVADTATSASHAVQADSATSASYATTASYAENGGVTSIIAGTNVTISPIGGTGDVTINAAGGATIDTGSFYTSSSITDATITFTQGDGSTESVTVNNVSSSISASHAVQADSATTATSATTSTSASHAVFADTAGSATTATSASHAVSADSSISASFATTATSASHAVNADSAISASFATTASYVEGGVGTLQQVTDAGNTTTNAIEVASTSKITNSNGAYNNDLVITQNAGATKFDNSGSDAVDMYFDVDGTRFIDLDTNGANVIRLNQNTDVTGAVTASAGFKGDLDGNAATASTGSAVSIFGDATNADRKLVFVDDNPSDGSSQVEQLRGDTSKSITYNPSTNEFKVSGSVVVDGLLQSGVGHTNSSTAGSNVLVGGDTHVISSGVLRSGMFAGWDSDITAGNASAIIAGGANALSSNYAVILGGEGNNVSAAYCGVLVGASNTISNADTSVIIGGYQNNVQGVRTTVLNGYQNVIQNTNVDGSTIIGGQQNTIPTGISQSAIIAGEGITADASDTVFVPNLHLTGSKGGTLTFADGTTQTSAGISFPYTGSAEITGSLGVTGSVGIVASGTNAPFLNSVVSGNPSAGEALLAVASGDANINTSAKASGVFGATNATIGSSAFQAVIVGGDEHDANGIRTGVFGGYNNNVSSGNSYIFGGSYHDITGGLGQIFGGNNSTISGGSYAVTLGGQNNTISAGNYNALVGGSGNTATHNYSVVIGGQSLSTSKVNEVVVPDLTTNGVVKQNVTALSITSNTASLDASDGNLFTLTLGNGVDTHLELSNQTAGQTFQLKITNNATAAGTITFDSQFEFEGGAAFTATAATSAVDILTFTTFDGTSVQCVGAKNFS